MVLEKRRSFHPIETFLEIMILQKKIVKPLVKKRWIEKYQNKETKRPRSRMSDTEISPSDIMTTHNKKYLAEKNISWNCEYTTQNELEYITGKRDLPSTSGVETNIATQKVEFKKKRKHVTSTVKGNPKQGNQLPGVPSLQSQIRIQNIKIRMNPTLLKTSKKMRLACPVNCYFLR